MATEKQISIIVTAKDQASKVFSGIGSALSTALGTFAGGAALNLASKGFDTLTSAIGNGISDAQQAAVVMGQTEAAIKSTGGAAGVTAQQIQDMAGNLSAAAGKSLFGDDDIQRGENMLLTFTNIKDTLPDATQTMIDMAQATGTDMKGAALQLGKALNDPTKGISALSRVGVTFTDQQKKQIKAMQEAGDTAGAQKIILAELNKEFGGSAAAAAAAAGPMAQLKDQMGELGESLGRAVLPLVNQFFGFLASDTVQGALGDLVDAFSEIVASFQSGGFAEGVRSLMAVLQSFGSDLFAWIASVTPGILAQLAAWGQAFIDWVAPMIPPALAALGNLILQLGAWLVAQVPTIVAQLQAWGQAFVAWIAPMIPPFLAQLATLAQGLWDWIVAQAAPLLAQLQTWATAFVAWIGPATVQFLQEWPKMFDQFLSWIGAQAGPLLAKLGDWAVQFVAWIIPMIPGFLLALGAIAVAIVTFVGETAITLGTKIITEWVPAFIDWIKTSAIPKLGPALKTMLDAILAWITGTALPWLTENTKQLGTYFIDGVKIGINDAMTSLNTAVTNVFNGAMTLAENIVKGAVDNILGFIIHAIQRIQELISWIGRIPSIHVPTPTPPSDGGAGGGSGRGAEGFGGTNNYYVQVKDGYALNSFMRKTGN